ncbi:MAG: hypothetical protein KBT03_05555 [Bacteroidales bacterium]|nr:hypothetical protein [Candidatus Scybalousia scybalohippi]
MNTERTIILENVAEQPIGLKDTLQRTYRLGVGAKIRISEVSLQDILDYPASKVIFAEGLVKVRNISAKTLYNMGLTEKEIAKFAEITEEENVVVITEKPYDEVVEEEEEIIPVEKPVAKPATATKTTAKKPAAKKSTGKKSTTKKSSK